MTDIGAMLKGGVAVVTGASGGLGRALALELCGKGMTVAGMARSGDGLAETAAMAGPDFHPIRADLSYAEAVIAAFKEIRAIGPVTVLVNNAAVYPRRDFLDETGSSFMATIDTNLSGTVHATRAALEDMVTQGFGRILNVATFADLTPLPASSAYSVSKGAARIFTRAVIADLADRFPDIVIGDWMPGMLRTGMGIPDGLDPAQSAKWGAELALWHDPSLTGAVFEMDREILPPRSLKARIRDKLLMRRQVVRRLGQG